MDGAEDPTWEAIGGYGIRIGTRAEAQTENESPTRDQEALKAAKAELEVAQTSPVVVCPGKWIMFPWANVTLPRGNEVVSLGNRGRFPGQSSLRSSNWGRR